MGIEDGDEAAILPHAEVVLEGAKADAGVEVGASDNGAADVGTGQVGGADEGAVEFEPVELIANAGGADHEWLGATGIDGDAVGLDELTGVTGLGAFAAEFADELAGGIKLEDPL